MIHGDMKRSGAFGLKLTSIRWIGASLAAAFSLSACASVAPPPPPPPPPSDFSGSTADLARDWRGIIQPQDLERYRALEASWTLALQQARELKGSGNLRSLGDLIIPGATRDFVTPPTGQYRCRTVKLGSQDGQMGYIIYGWFACRIDHSPAGMKLTKLSGSQRPSGIFFPENDHQMVFLGSMALTNEPNPNAYGLNPDRDMVGVLERIGETRWRLSIPQPQQESLLDLLELVPANTRN